MMSGETRLIADNSASGMFISAVVNITIARPSNIVRPSTSGLVNRSADICPIASMIEPTSIVASVPRTVMTSPSG